MSRQSGTRLQGEERHLKHGSGAEAVATMVCRADEQLVARFTARQVEEVLILREVAGSVSDGSDCIFWHPRHGCNVCDGQPTACTQGDASTLVLAIAKVGHEHLGLLDPPVVQMVVEIIACVGGVLHRQWWLRQ